MLFSISLLLIELSPP